jgi:diaminopimelate epimerase
VLPFVKTEALGNDFLLVRRSELADLDYAGTAREICDRRRGVGADGLILWDERTGEGPFPLRIYNSDGSEAECSGNGLRCMAAWLFGSGRAEDSVLLETVSGIYTLRPAGNQYTADMGEPELAPEAIPTTLGGRGGRVVDHPLEVNGETVRVTCSQTGNPHCSLFVDGLDSGEVNRLGPLIERHPSFPKRTNVEFVRVLSPSAIEVAFWERGAGPTPASGTGSCGATVAAVLNGRTGRKVTVHTVNGDLGVEWGEDGRLALTAPAAMVAEGNYFLKVRA